MIGSRKVEGRVWCTVLLRIIRKSQMPSENRLTAIQNWKKPKLVIGFESGLPRQNTPCASIYRQNLDFAMLFGYLQYQEKYIFLYRRNWELVGAENRGELQGQGSVHHRPVRQLHRPSSQPPPERNPESGRKHCRQRWLEGSILGLLWEHLIYWV